MKRIVFAVIILLVLSCYYSMGADKEAPVNAPLCKIGAPWSCIVQGDKLYLFTTTTRRQGTLNRLTPGNKEITEMANPWETDDIPKNEYDRDIFWLFNKVDLAQGKIKENIVNWNLIKCDMFAFFHIPQIAVSINEKNDKILIIREGMGSGAGFRHLEYNWVPIHLDTDKSIILDVPKLHSTFSSNEKQNADAIITGRIRGIIVEGENRGKVYDADLSEPAIYFAKNSVWLTGTRTRKEIWVSEVPTGKGSGKSWADDIPAVILGEGRMPVLLYDGTRFICFAIVPSDLTTRDTETISGRLVCWESADAKKWTKSAWNLDKNNINQINACVLGNGKVLLSVCETNTGALSLYLIYKNGIHPIPLGSTGKKITAKNPKIRVYNQDLLLLSEEKISGNPIIKLDKLISIDEIFEIIKDIDK